MTRPLAVEERQDTGTLHCVTRENRRSPQEYLAVCDDNPVDVITSVWCPAECGGHPVCAPCIALGRQSGLIR